jgi:hypothetical protein
MCARFLFKINPALENKLSQATEEAGIDKNFRATFATKGKRSCRSLNQSKGSYIFPVSSKGLAKPGSPKNTSSSEWKEEEPEEEDDDAEEDDDDEEEKSEEEKKDEGRTE